MSATANVGEPATPGPRGQPWVPAPLAFKDEDSSPPFPAE